MKNRTKFLVSVYIMAASLQFARGAETSNLFERPNADVGPTQISTAIWLVDINSIDSAQQNFTADVFLVLQWKDPRLAHSGGGTTHYTLDQIWHPRVGIVNETNSVSHRLPESVEVEADGTVVYRQRYVGSFTQSLRLRSFPFDQQTFRIQLVAVKYGPDEVKFVPNERWLEAGLKQGGGISSSVTLPDWKIKNWDIKSVVYTPAPKLDSASYVFEFTASRNVSHYILKVILPLVLIVIMSWAVFWLDPVHSNSQINIAVTSMLTLIAYRFAIDSQLPRLPYMTRLDAFILTSTLLVFFTLVEVLITTIMDTGKRTTVAKRIDRYCRFLFPMIFAIASVAIFVKPRE